MAQALASFDLLLLCVLTLSLAVLDSPVPRPWALAAAALLSVQCFAVHEMGEQPVSAPAPGSDAIVHTFAETVALLAVPTLTAALLTVVFYYCARAYARARVRLDAAMRAQSSTVLRQLPVRNRRTPP